LPIRDGEILPQSEHDASAESEPSGIGLRDPLTLVLLAAAFVYALLTIDRGWIPHDDGMLGQAALRVLTGELPHRDFQDVYTGALGYWHALSFVLFGIHLISPRLLLLVSFAGFLAAAYGISRRFAPPRTAALVVLLASVWSLPNYPAAMPTWYNLFLAVAGLWCLFQYMETGRRGWLLAAGTACGVSIIIKIVGLYTLAAFLMVLALVEARGTPEAPGHVDGSLDGSPDGGEDGGEDGGRAATTPRYTIVLSVGLSLYVLLVLWMVRSSLDVVTVVHFLVPSVAVCGMTAWWVHTPERSGGLLARLTRFARLAGTLAVGVAIPVALFALPYLITGSVADLVVGTLLLPFRRLTFAAAAPLPLQLFLPALPLLALFALAGLGRGIAQRVGLWIFSIGLVVTLALGGGDAVYRGTWGGLLLSPVIGTVAVLLAAGWARHRGDTSDRPQKAIAIGAVLGTFTLVQYPFSGPVYFYYIAPLVALAGLAAASLAGRAWRAPTVALMVFALLFGARWVGTASLFPTAQGRYEPRPSTERLQLERGRIRVSTEEKAEYERLAVMLSERSLGTGVTFVTPDAPEAYFLSGLRNPTPVFYDFLDDPEGRTARILAMLEEEDVRVVALNRSPQFSGRPPDDLIAGLENLYPQAANVGRFIVRWR